MNRAAFIDETGSPVGSDLSTALIAGELLERHPGTAVVYDLRSSRAVAEYIRERGGVPIRERVGHSFIKATLREHGGVKDFPDAEYVADGSTVLETECDILIPAALESQIGEQNAGRIRARLIAEAANARGE